MPVCERVYLGSLSCDVVRYGNDGNQINFSATLLEQPFGDDTPTHGLAVSTDGFIYLSGTTGHFGVDERAIIERFNEDLSGGVELIDLSAYGVPPMTHVLSLTPMVIGREGHIFIWTPAKAGIPTNSTYPLMLFEFATDGTLLNSWNPGGLSTFITAFNGEYDGQLKSMDTILPSGLLLLHLWGLHPFLKFSPFTGNVVASFDATLSGTPVQIFDMAVLADNTVVGWALQLFPFANVFARFSAADGVITRQYDISVAGYSAGPFLGARMVTRGPEGIDPSFWISAAFPGPDPQPIYVQLVDLDTGAVVTGGQMTTNFSAEDIINIATCSKVIPPRTRSTPFATLIGAT